MRSVNITKIISALTVLLLILLLVFNASYIKELVDGNDLVRDIKYFSGQLASHDRFRTDQAMRTEEKMASITVSSSAELTNALSKAAAGDTILLTAGNYGDVKISSLSFTAPVTIQSADASNPAVFRSIGIYGSHQLTFSNVEVQFTPTLTTLSYDNAVRIQDSSDISFTHSKFVGGDAINGVVATATMLDATGNVIGYPTARAIFVMNSTGVSVTANDISGFYKGVFLSNVDHLTVTQNEIHDLRGTPISGGDVSTSEISGNYLHDIKPWNFSPTGDHADFIHIWTSLTTQSSATTGLVISDNFLDQGAGTAVLGIYLDDDTNALGFTNTTVSNNVVYNGELQGLRLENVTNSVASGNVLLQSSGAAKDGPGIILSGSSDGLTLSRNVISGLDLTHIAGDSRGNVLVQSVDSSAAHFSGHLEGTALSWDQAMAIREQLTGQTHVTSPLPWSSAGLLTPENQVPDTPTTSTSSADVLITGTDKADQLSASGNGIVWVHGKAGNDLITGNSGDHSLFGDSGDDTYVVTSFATKIVEKSGEGTDLVQSSIDFILTDNVENLTLLSGAHAGTGNVLNNIINGTRDTNRLAGLDGADILNGASASDSLFGGNGDDRLAANGGNDTLYGEAGNDRLVGGGDNDVLFGGDGDDRLVGGADADRLYGGEGNDRFAYSDADIASKRNVGFDTIMDFSLGDKIDLDSMDASTKARGDNAFTFIGDSAFTGVAGQLRYYTDSSHTYVCADRNGDKVADFTICLDGIHALHNTDFVL